MLDFLAAIAFWLATLNGFVLLRHGLAARNRARRLGAHVLAAVCGGLSLEALLFLLLATPADEGAALAALLLARTALLLSSGALAVLLLRGLRSRR